MDKKEAVVLKTIDYKETSKILYLYHEDGKSSVLVKGAKNIKSKLRNASEILTHIKYSKTKSKFPIMTNCDVVNNFTNIKYDLNKQIYSCHIIEYVYDLCEYEINNKSLYRLLLKVLNKIENGFNEEILSFVFELKLLYFLGFGLDFSKDNYIFKNYNTEFIEIIKRLYYIKIDDIPNKEMLLSNKIGIRKFLDIFYSDNLSYKTNSRKMIESIYKY